MPVKRRQPTTQVVRDMTEAQRRVYGVIESWINTKGYSPTVTQVMDGAGFRSPGAVHRHIVLLRRSGWLAKDTSRIELGPKAARVAGHIDPCHCHELQTQIDELKATLANLRQEVATTVMQHQ